MRIFAASGKPQDISRHVDCYRLFKRREPWGDLPALASGPKDTRELAIELMKAKGMDTGDKVLAKSLHIDSSIRCGCRPGAGGCSATASGRASRFCGCQSLTRQQRGLQLLAGPAALLTSSPAINGLP